MFEPINNSVISAISNIILNWRGGCGTELKSMCSRYCKVKWTEQLVNFGDSTPTDYGCSTHGFLCQELEQSRQSRIDFWYQSGFRRIGNKRSIEVEQ